MKGKSVLFMGTAHFCAPGCILCTGHRGVWQQPLIQPVSHPASTQPNSPAKRKSFLVPNGSSFPFLPSNASGGRFHWIESWGIHALPTTLLSNRQMPSLHLLSCPITCMWGVGSPQDGVVGLAVQLTPSPSRAAPQPPGRPSTCHHWVAAPFPCNINNYDIRRVI